MDLRLPSQNAHSRLDPVFLLQILQEYPLLEADDISQALQYAAVLTNEELHPLTGNPL